MWTLFPDEKFSLQCRVSASIYGIKRVVAKQSLDPQHCVLKRILDILFWPICSHSWAYALACSCSQESYPVMWDRSDGLIWVWWIPYSPSQWLQTNVICPTYDLGFQASFPPPTGLLRQPIHKWETAMLTFPGETQMISSHPRLIPKYNFTKSNRVRPESLLGFLKENGWGLLQESG